MLEDVRYAARGLRKNPGFTAIAALTLGLGIGATTAIFSVVSGVLLRPLPFTDPDRLVQVNETEPRFGAGSVSYPDLNDFRKRSTSFDVMIAYVPGRRNLVGITEPERIVTVAAERGLFRLLGVEPVAGRTFRDDDPPNVAVVSAGFGKRHFGRDPSVIGRKITLDGESFTVIGVMPEQFQFPCGAVPSEVWIPWEPAQAWVHDRRYHADFVVGRLKPGVSIDAARNELSLMAKRTEAGSLDSTQGRGVLLTPLSEITAEPVRSSFLILLGAVGLVLLVACANVANLLLARAAGRTREVAIRASLGAGPVRLIRQFLTESVLIGLGGGLLGLAIATWATELLLKLAAAQIPRWWDVGLDWRVFAFLLALCVATGIGFGLVPAISAARVDIQTGLKAADGRAGNGRGRFRDGLVVAEVTLAFVLLIGAGLLMRAFLRLQATPTGLVTENVLTLHVSGDANARRFYELEQQISRLPGVRAAGFIQLLPLQDWGWTGHFTVDGRPETPSREPVAELRYVTPGYFRALGIPLRRGRGFTDHDTSDAPPAILINEALARQCFPNEDPIGKHTDRGTIVGVVGDVRQSRLDRPPAPEIYSVLIQNLAQRPDLGMSLVVSTKEPPEKIVAAVRATIQQAEPNQVIFNVKTMGRVIADSLSDLDLYLWLIGLFAGLALALATAGIYGVVSHAISRRTREIGIRMALGAERRDVLRLVLRRTLALAGAGVLIGTVAALALTRVLQKFLFEVKPNDPATFIAAAALLTSVALAAGWIPAWRAARVDPVEALRYE